jgi:hypothetical protein
MNIYQLPALNNEDLFEDSICDLFDSLEKTKTFKKFGRKGHNQKGIDLFSSEKNIAIQCKKKDLSRKDILLKKELLDDIEKDLKKILNNDLKIKFDTLYFTSTFKDNPEIDEYCETLKEEFKTDFEIIYFGWDTLQSKFLEFNDLIKKYWPNFIINDDKELTIKRKLNLKDKISKDFSDWLNFRPENRKKRSRMILRSYNSEQYPITNNPDEFGEYSWFASEIKSLYHNGLEFITNIVTIEVFEDNSWDFPGNNKKSSGKLIGVMKVGQINFSDIVGYDIAGDEYYNCPHIYCKFRFKGLPFENIYYQHLEKSFLKFEIEDKRT